jgi:hypothetical protein
MKHDWKLVLQLPETKLWYCRAQKRFAISGHDTPPDQDPHRHVLWVRTDRPITVEGRTMHLAGEWNGHAMPVALDLEEAFEIASFLNLEIRFDNAHRFVAAKTTNGSSAASLRTIGQITEAYGYGVGPFLSFDDVNDVYEDIDYQTAARIIDEVEDIVSRTCDWNALITQAGETLARAPA